MRARARSLVVRKLMFWLEGPGMLAPGDPRQRITLTGPSWPTFKSLEVESLEGVHVVMGRYSGMHYTATVAHGGEHHTDWVSMFGAYLVDGSWVRAEGGTFSNGPVVIGNDVWIGYEALIMSGVTIGDGAAVGARTVVRRSIEPFEIVGGNPIRHLGYRFDEPTRDALLRIRWWDWPDEKATAHRDQIHSADVAGFVERHDPARGAPSCSLCS
jgi:hypothetical protein